MFLPFSGIGFKAVYKRFEKVTIFDNIWSFQFEQPASTPPMEPSFSWVLKPKWIREMDSYRHISSGIGKISEKNTDCWCNFVLERSRGGGNDIKEDLSRLPSVVPVLLGRQAIDPDCTTEEEDGKWVLCWGEKQYTITKGTIDPTYLEAKLKSRQDSISSHHLRRDRKANVSGSLMGSFFDTFCSRICGSFKNHSSGSSSHRIVGSNNQTWQFLTVCFDPSKSAKVAFEGHTKRPWAGRLYHADSFFSAESPDSDVVAEEISLFFQIDENLAPVALPKHTSAGLLHAVLPTKLKLPFPMNLQASWLLSVDRREVQSLSENAWNNCLISQVYYLSFFTFCNSSLTFILFAVARFSGAVFSMDSVE